MANVTLGHLVDLVTVNLQDSGNDNWTETNLINWYNLACRETVTLAPDANTVITTMKLASGVKQSVPAGTIKLLNVIRNMGTDGETAGPAVNPTTVQLMQAFDRDWDQATATEAIKNWMPESALTWYCYPPSDGTGYVEIEIAKPPDQVTYDADGDWENELVGVTDRYVNAIFNWILYQAYKKDSDYPGNENRASGYYQAFLNAVGAVGKP